MSSYDKNREFCDRMMREDPFNAPKWEMVRRWANEDCNRELVDGYSFAEEWWEKFSEYVCFEERDMPVLEVVAGTLQVCGDERVTRREGEERLEFELRELCEVWEEIIKGADDLIESDWKPEPAPSPVIDAKQPEPEPPPDEAVVAKGAELNAQQLIFVKMLLEQWKHYCETRNPLTDEAAAERVGGGNTYTTSSRSQATAYNKWKNQNIPNDLRPPKSNRGGKRSPK